MKYWTLCHGIIVDHRHIVNVIENKTKRVDLLYGVIMSDK